MIPVVASVIVGTFTGVRYIVSLTETINKNKAVYNEYESEQKSTTFKELDLYSKKLYKEKGYNEEKIDI